MPKIPLNSFPAKENREGRNEIVITRNSITVLSTDKMMPFFSWNNSSNMEPLWGSELADALLETAN